MSLPARSRVFGAISLLFLAGCSAIPLSDIAPVISSGANGCSSPKAFLLDSSRGPRPNPGFAFLLPKASQVAAEDVRVLPNGRSSAAFRTVNTFSAFEQKAYSSKQLLPASLQNDDVTDALFRLMIKTSAQAQIAAGKAAGLEVDKGIEDAVNAYSVPGSLTHGEVKAFATAISASGLKPTIAVPSSARTAEDSNKNAFATYFTDYYEGKFVDKLGQAIKKPQLAGSTITVPVSITIPDADIATALTVLLEYVIDLVDPTPVLIDTPDITATTKYYPGGTTSKPTVLSANLANYKQLSSTCGVTAQNAKLLADVANAAGDEAATLGGLVSQSAGGFGISLGVFGKISIGDNQTLGTVVKTAASRLALRSTFAASYWALESITVPGPARLPSGAIVPAPGIDGPNGYLLFSPL